MNTQDILAYHTQIGRENTGSKEICLIAEAIIDKETPNLDLLWTSTDFANLFTALAQYPANWVIGQHRDYLRDKVNKLKKKEAMND